MVLTVCNSYSFQFVYNSLEIGNGASCGFGDIMLCSILFGQLF